MIRAGRPSPPAPPPRRAETLWRRLADDQDMALAAEEMARGNNMLGACAPRSRIVAVAEGASFAGPAGATPRRRSRLGRRRALAGGAAGVMVAIAAAVALVVWAPHRQTLSVQVGSASGRAAAPVPSLVADARADLPLRFSDGSTVTFRAGSAGRLASLSGSGAEVILERGALEAHVVHAASTAWIVRAGPYRVRVTGTRFSVAWRAGRLDVILKEGAVIVDGAALGAGVPLQAGRRLTVASGVVRIEPFGATPATSVAAGRPRREEGDRKDDHGPTEDVGAWGAAVGPEAQAFPPGSGRHTPAGLAPSVAQTPVAAPSDDTTASRTLARLEAAPVDGLLRGRSPGGAAAIGRPAPQNDDEEGRGRADGPTPRANTPDGRAPENDSRHRRGPHAIGASPDDAWVSLAERGRYREALASARHLGWSNLCRRLDARRLLTLADVARYSGARGPARRAFEALARRYPRDRLAGDAVFSLGKMAFEAGRPAEATRWFHRYGADWPDGPLGDEAAGRLVESAIRLDDTAAARAAAHAYLARAPHGAQAALARGVLADPADGAP